MKTALKVAGIALLGLVLGLGSAAFVLWRGSQASWIQNGPWRTSLHTGSKDAGMYTRAVVSVVGLFALNKSEAIYFVARTDGEGRTLTSRCAYRVEGTHIAARWWSITLYGGDFFLIPNPQKRYSFTRKELQGKELQKPWRFTVAKSRQKGLWLPSGEQSRLLLTLRLYNPDPALLQHLKQAALPTITRVKGSCGGGS